MNIFESIATFFATKKGEKELDIDDNRVSFVPFQDEQGGEVIDAGGTNTGLVNFDPSTENEQLLIGQYRDAARFPEVNEAIDEIVNEMISRDEEDQIINLNLEDVELSAGLKDKIHTEFDEILRIMDFEKKGPEYVRKWYVDGRLAFHKVIDKKKEKDGIKELRYINPTSIKKITEVKRETENGIEVQKVVKEYFTYNPTAKNPLVSLSGQGTSNAGSSTNGNWNYASPLLNGVKQAIQVSPEAIVFSTSGMYDEQYGCVTSYLHTAIRMVNQLRALEDSLVIYRISRAPERRIFYVDVGNLAKGKAEQYMNGLMAKFKNTVSYDPLTGAVKDSKRHLSMMEDFWIPRRENGKATEITTLPGGQNLGQMDDVEYFLKKLYKSLKVPASRFITDQPLIAGMGRTSEITRDEIRFQKFIDRLRDKFNGIFLDLLKTQLTLKKLVSDEDWEEIVKNIRLEWAKDNFYTELKEQDILRERLTTLQQMDPYVGKYFTKEYVLKSVLRVSDEEYDELLQALDKENAEQAQTELDTQLDMNDALHQQGLEQTEDTLKLQQKYTPDEAPRLPVRDTNSAPKKKDE